MGKYLKLFENHSAYEAAESGLILPNVSYCESENEVHYNPIISTEPIVAKYSVVNTSEPILLYSEPSNNPYFSKVEVDDTEVELISFEQDDIVFYGYQFATTGEHTVKYTMIDSTIINDSTFSDCESIMEVVIPNSVTSIDDYAFNQCTSLSSITIPNSVTSIGNGTFEYCRSLTSITIPDSVTSIGSTAFYHCSGLTSIDIPNGVTNIGDSVFESCRSLISITVEATAPPTLGTQCFNDNASQQKIYVPSESVNAYKTATHWSTYASRIQAIP